MQPQRFDASNRRFSPCGSATDDAITYWLNDKALADRYHNDAEFHASIALLRRIFVALEEATIGMNLTRVESHITRSTLTAQLIGTLDELRPQDAKVGRDLLVAAGILPGAEQLRENIAARIEHSPGYEMARALGNRHRVEAYQDAAALARTTETS